MKRRQNIASSSQCQNSMSPRHLLLLRLFPNNTRRATLIDNSPPHISMGGRIEALRISFACSGELAASFFDVTDFAGRRVLAKTAATRAECRMCASTGCARP